MSKHKKHISNNDSFLNKVFSKEQSKETYTDLEWEAKQGLDQLGEERTIKALARIHKRIESQKRKQSKTPTVIPFWRYAAAAACAGILVFVGNQIINSTDNKGPISYDTQKTQDQDIPQDKGQTTSTEASQEATTDQSTPDQASSVDGGLNKPNQDLEMEIKDNAILPAPSPPPAEPALPTEVVKERIVFEEVDSEEIVILDRPNNVEDILSSQGSAVIEQEENLTEALLEDEMMPEMTNRSSEKNSLSMEGMADSDVQEESVYGWSIAFSEKQFQEITKRFEESDWAEQHTNEDAMFFTARAYHALGNFNKATEIMQEIVHLNAEKAQQAKSYLEQWEK